MSGLRIKSGKWGADVRFLEPAIVLAILIAERLWEEMFPGIPLVLSSGNEGKHTDHSKHYVGFAIDFRTKDPEGKYALTADQRNAFVHELRARLGDEFQVVVSDTYKNVHIELDPAKGLR